MIIATRKLCQPRKLLYELISCPNIVNAKFPGKRSRVVWKPLPVTGKVQHRKSNFSTTELSAHVQRLVEAEEVVNKKAQPKDNIFLGSSRANQLLCRVIYLWWIAPFWWEAMIGTMMWMWNKWERWTLGRWSFIFFSPLLLFRKQERSNLASTLV